MTIRCLLNSFENETNEQAMIKESELILNNDGTIFHLHLKPDQISDTIILVGDPARVDLVASNFDKVDLKVSNREFVTKTGWLNGKKLTVLSTGIGTDNIDIVMNELDALANIDLETRQIKKQHQSLNIIRIGTSGALQKDIAVNSYVVSLKSIGFDGMLNYYANRESVSDMLFEKRFREFTSWDQSLPTPYVINASEKLLSKFTEKEFLKGVTISAPGFYGPQGRVLRLPLSNPELNHLIEDFGFNGLRITNFEMESSAIYGLSKLLGHHAMCVCAIIANRVSGEANENYHQNMEILVKKVLEKITT